jgi:hypothetical protein
MMLAALVCAGLLVCAPDAGNALPGDPIADCSLVASGASATIRPGAGESWIIHNIWFKYNVELIRTNGTVTLDGLQFLGPDFLPTVFHVTNGNYLQVKNLHDSTAFGVCWDGLVTK